MALIDFEGFDRETVSQLSNWFHINTTFNISADLGGPFGYGRCATTPFYSGRTFSPASSVLWMNCHVRQTNTGSGSAQPIFGFMDSGTLQVGWNLTSDLRGVLIVGGSIVSTSALPIMALNAWYFVQLRVSIANAGGTINLYVNGVLAMTYTGDTQNTANNTANQWVVSNSNNATNTDNVVVYDETGAVPNARTPETRIFTDLPTGAGFASAWTPSAGANWQNVDEQPNDGDTTYNSAAAAALDDLYAYPAATIPAASIIYAVAAEYDVRKDDAGANEVDALMRSGGVTYAAADVKTLTSSWQRMRSHWTLDPATGAAWTVANANAASVGIRRTT